MPPVWVSRCFNRDFDDSVRINDAFEVVGGDWDLSNVAIGLDFRQSLS